MKKSTLKRYSLAAREAHGRRIEILHKFREEVIGLLQGAEESLAILESMDDPDEDPEGFVEAIKLLHRNYYFGKKLEDLQYYYAHSDWVEYWS